MEGCVLYVLNVTQGDLVVAASDGQAAPARCKVDRVDALAVQTNAAQQLWVGRKADMKHNK